MNGRELPATAFSNHGVLTRRNFMALAGAGLIGSAVPHSLRAEVATNNRRRRPNIVLIFADDLGYGDLSCYNQRAEPTPNIDSIADNGVRFTDGYVTAPMCSPSRAGLMTGRYQQRFGHEFNAGGASRSHTQGLGLPVSERTIADVLKKAGYATGMIGKSHLGSQTRFMPTNRGFDEFFGFLHGANTYIEPSDARGIHSYDKPKRNTRTSKTRTALQSLYRGTTAVKEPEYLTDAFTREALSFIERHANEPFFLYVAYNAVHTPLQVTDRYYRRFAHIKNEPLRIYTAMIHALDEGVGAILNKLKQQSLEKDTLLFFISDNGAVHRLGSNHPLLAGKLYPFEGGIRVPFLAQWPGHIPAGLQFRQPVISLDVFATAVALGQAEPPADRPIDGTDLMPYLTGRSRGAPHGILFWRNGTNVAVRKGRWKYINLNRKRTLLFDLQEDVGEKHDLSKDEPEIVAELEKALAEWEGQTIEPLWPSRGTVPVRLDAHGLGGGTYELFI